MVNDVYKRRMAIAAATDNLPDVFITWSGATLQEYACLGKILPLTEFMNKETRSTRTGFFPRPSSRPAWTGISGRCRWNAAPGMGFYNVALFARFGRCR